MQKHTNGETDGLNQNVKIKSQKNDNAFLCRENTYRKISLRVKNVQSFDNLKWKTWKRTCHYINSVFLL